MKAIPIYLCLVALLFSACTSGASTLMAASPTALKTATSTPFPVPTATPKPPPTASSTPIPSPTPLPSFIGGEFEFPFQSGLIPAELQAEGFRDMELGTIESMGRGIPIDGMQALNLIPLACDSAVLNAVSGNVVFLPFPAKMDAENGQALTYSPDRSGRGWAAYVDDLGLVVAKLLTLIPNTAGAIIVAAVSHNPDDMGTVYAVKLSPSGEVLGKADLVFRPTTAISVVYENGEVDVNINNNPVLPNFQSGEWEADLKALLAQEGIIFPATTASIYETEHYGFSVFFSQGIFANSGFRDLRDANGNINIHIPPEVMDRWILQQMGMYMYFQRDLSPRFDVFIDMGEDICTDFDYSRNEEKYTGDPVFMDSAREILGDGPVPLQFRWISENISGVVDSVEFNFVSKAEFALVHDLFDEREIDYAYHWPDPNLGFAPADYGYLYFFGGNTLYVYEYNRRPSTHWPVDSSPETATSGRSIWAYLHSMNRYIEETITELQFHFIGPDDWGRGCEDFAANTYVSHVDFLCTFIYEGILVTDCLEAADIYFSP